MPDHVHVLFTPYGTHNLGTMVHRLKSVSARGINRVLRRHGHVWQREYFDRIMRGHEDLRKKVEYICNNPLRAGLVTSTDEYPWIWRSWMEGKAPPGSAALH